MWPVVLTGPVVNQDQRSGVRGQGSTTQTESPNVDLKAVIFTELETKVSWSELKIMLNEYLDHWRRI